MSNTKKLVGEVGVGAGVEKKDMTVREYRKPEVHDLGKLEQVQHGRYGNNYDGSSRWWYYE